MLKFAIEHAPVLQLVAYVALTVSTILVATLSAIFAYRHNFGWKPLCIVTTRGISGIGGDPENFNATLSFEVWNRWKYPIVVRSATVTYSSMKFKGHHHGNWFLNRQSELHWVKESPTAGDVVVAPTSHHTFALEVPFEKVGLLDDINENITIVVDYYDPRSAKHRKLKVETTFSLKSR